MRSRDKLCPSSKVDSASKSDRCLLIYYNLELWWGYINREYIISIAIQRHEGKVQESASEGVDYEVS